MKFQFIWVSWKRGDWFQFGREYFNGGKSYKVYRLGAFYLRKYD